MSTTSPAESVAGDLQRLLEVKQREVRCKLSPPWWRPWGRPDPELSKVLSQIHSGLSEISRLMVRRREGGHWPYVKEIEPQLRAVLKEENLTRLNINAAWEFSDSLRRMLLLLGDDSYIMAHLMNERAGSADENRRLKWETFLELPGTKNGSAGGARAPALLEKLLEDYREHRVSDPARALTVEYLTLLYSSRSRAGRIHRAEIDMRARYLKHLSRTLFVLLLLLSIFTFFASEKALNFLPSGNLRDLSLLGLLTQYLNSPHVRFFLIAGSAGAIGGVLSGFIKLRDQVKEMSDLRSYSAAMRAQPFVGATVGALFYLLLASGILGAGEMDAGFTSASKMSWPLVAINCFLAGYSEPFFLRVVQRVGGAADKQAETQTAAKADSERRREAEKRPVPTAA